MSTSRYVRKFAPIFVSCYSIWMQSFPLVIPIYSQDSSILRCIHVNSQTKWSMPKIKHTLSNTLCCSSFPPNNFSLTSIRTIEENTFYTKLRIHIHRDNTQPPSN